MTAPLTLDALAGISTGVASLWVRMCWQSTTLAAAGWLALRTMPRLSARVRYQGLFGCYVLCLALPFAAWLLPAQARHAAVASAAPLLTLDPHWAVVWTALCALASIAALARFAAGLWSMRRMIRGAHEAAAATQRQHADALASSARGAVRLLISSEINAPVAVGLGRPAVVLPEGMLEQLCAGELDQVLRHEVEHLARRDDWAALLFALVRCAVPLMPALLWLERQLATAREMACDDAVLRAARPRAYAENLARLAATRFLRRVPRFAPELLGRTSQLAQRIDHILDSSTRGVTSVPLRRLLPISAAALTVCVGLVESPAVVGFAPPSSPVARVVPAGITVTPELHAIPASLKVPSAPAVAALPAVVHTRRKHHHAVAPKPLMVAENSAADPSALRAAAVEPASAAAEPSALQFVLVFWNSTRQELWFSTTTLVFHTGPATRSGVGKGLHQI